MTTDIGSDATGVIEYCRSGRESMEYCAQRNGKCISIDGKALLGRLRSRWEGKYINLSHKYTSSGYGTQPSDSGQGSLLLLLLT
jgi:hypothetical protein